MPHTDLYQLLEELDRIEDLLEDMAALGIHNRAGAEARMLQLNTLLDEREGHDPPQRRDDGTPRQ
ncbi:MAG: hypothetical protein M3464_15460 [Chloroflexota bacterium]|nr:hypothetical protein [Chloroflexota bacterium]